jgi:hypothetical protein
MLPRYEYGKDSHSARKVSYSNGMVQNQEVLYLLSPSLFLDEKRKIDYKEFLSTITIM